MNPILSATISLGLIFSGCGFKPRALDLVNQAQPEQAAATADTATQLAFTVQPSDAITGNAISPAVKVSVLDKNGAVVTASTAKVTLAIGTNPGGGTLAGTLTAEAVSGVATFSDLSLNRAGTGYTLTATSGSLTAATSNSFTIFGPATKVVFTVQPTDTAAGDLIVPSVKAEMQDVDGNRVTTSSANVTLAIANNAGGGTLSGTLTIAASAGTATFSNLSINKVGTGYTLSATSSGLTSATSNAFNITPAAAAKLAFTVEPTDAVAGVAISPAVKVTIQDAYGNTVTSSSINITLAIANNAGGGTLSGTLTQAASSGVATFSNLSINKSGTGYTLSAASTGLTGATSASFNITHAAASKLAFTVQPSNTQAAATISPSVQITVQDQFGNTVTNSSASITLAIDTNPPGNGVLSGTLTRSASSGVATFSGLSIDKTGTGYKLSAASTGLTSATSDAFNITNSAATKLAFKVQPSNTVAGVSISPSVEVSIQDASGNIVTDATNSITLAIANNAGGGALSGTLTRAAVAGVATFSGLSINKSGTGYTLSAAASGLTGATSDVFNITHATASKLAFTVQPSDSSAGVSISPAIQVTVLDGFDNTVTNSSASVTLAIDTNPPGNGVLSGTLTRAASSGVATFSGLSIDKTGTGYKLSAASSGLASSTSSAFNILGPSQLNWTSGLASTKITACNPYTVTSQDLNSVAINVGSDTTITFTGLGSGKFYSDVCVTELSKNGSGNYITTITSGTSSKTIYFKDTVVENLIFSAAASNLTTGTKSVNVLAALLSYFGDGANGSLTISSSQSVNSYAYMNGDHNVGTTSIAVDSILGFSAGREVLIIGMEGASAGIFEFATLVSVSGTTLTLSSGLKNAYVSGVSNTAAPNAKTTQIITVPQYTDVTVNGGGSIIPGQAWDGTKGGVIVFRAKGTVTVNGSLNATGYGFSGGLGTVGAIGFQGNSINGKGVQGMAANAGGGGGGGGHINACGGSSAAGGGGGAYASGATSNAGSCGPLSPCAASVGSTYGVSNLSKIFFGSGGGGGGACTGSTAGNGGAGGGMILAFANTLSVAGSITATGANGSSGGIAGGGAGAGGSIVLVAESSTLGTNLISASGGSGGSGSCCGGGAGGVGRIAASFTSVTGSTGPAYAAWINTGLLTLLNYLTPIIYKVNETIDNNVPAFTGEAPTNYSMVTGLPTGLNLSTTTGVISGTPTALSSAANYTVIASNSESNAQATINLTVTSDPLVRSGLVLHLDASKNNGSSFGGTGCSNATWTDLSSYGNHGTLTGFSFCGGTSGWNGSGTTSDPYVLVFDGSDDYVNSGSDSSLDLTAVTLEAWVNPSSGQLGGIVDMAQTGATIENYAMLISNGTIYNQYYNSNSVLQQATYGSMWSIGTWVQAVITNNGSGTVTFYKNGAQVSQTTGLGSMVGAVANILKIGRYQIGSTGWFGGKIEEVRIYNRALTSTEVSTNCNARKDRFSGFTCN